MMISYHFTTGLNPCVFLLYYTFGKDLPLTRKAPQHHVEELGMVDPRQDDFRNFWMSDEIEKIYSLKKNCCIKNRQNLHKGSSVYVLPDFYAVPWIELSHINFTLKQ